MAFFVGAKVHQQSEGRESKQTADTTVPALSPVACGQTKRAQSTATVTSWVKSMLPSHRPERGGTIRRRGQRGPAPAPGSGFSSGQRRFSDSHHSLASVSGEPDRIVRWNTAKDMSQSDAEVSVPPKRAFSASHRHHARDGDQQQLTRESPGLQHRIEDSRPGNAGSDPLRHHAEHLRRHLSYMPDSGAAAIAERRLSKAQRLIEARRKIRKERRSLKESGDYLGVQGINPDTGELDIITPTDSEESSAGLAREKKVQALRKKLRRAREQPGEMDAAAVREVEGILDELELEQNSTNKNAIKRLNRVVKWRRQTKQWSSAQEPDLSPIAQSRRSTMPESPMATPCTPPRGEESPSPPLVDIMSGSRQAQKARRAVSFADSPSRRPSADTHGSHDTVVRTPYRQSLANISSAALELFENGIDFGRSQDNAVRSEPPTLSAGSDEKILRIQDTRASAPANKAIDSKVSVCHDEVAIPSVPDPFSEMGSGKHHRPPDPPAIARDSNLITLSPHVRDTPKHLYSHESTLSIVKGGRKGRTARHLEIVRSQITKLRNASPLGQNLDTVIEQRNGTLHRWVPPQLQSWRNRASSIQAEENRPVIHEVGGQPPVTKLATTPIVLESGQHRLGPNLSLYHVLDQDQGLERFRETMDMSQDPMRSVSLTMCADPDWIDSTVQEIVKCGKSDAEQLVHTPTTTTTTGSSRPKSRLSSKIDRATSIGECLSLPSTASTGTVDAQSFETFPKTDSSTSPSSTSDNDVNESDTTRRTLAHATQDCDLLPPRPKNTGQNDLIMLATPCDRQLTSTSTSPKIAGKRAGSSKTLRLYMVKQRTEKLRTHYGARTSLTRALHRVPHKLGDGTIQPHHPRMPGAYPNEDREDVVTADLFRSLISKVNSAMFTWPILEAGRLLCLILYRLAMLYWATVNPLFDAKSEFWKRHAKQQLTWTDGLRTLLAAPSAVLAITLFF